MALGEKALPRINAHVRVRPLHVTAPLTMNGLVSALLTASVVTSNPIDCTLFDYIGFGFIVSASTGAGAGAGVNIAFAEASAGPWYDALAVNVSAGDQYSHLVPVAATSNIMRIWKVVGPWARIRMNSQAASKMKIRNFKWFGST